MGKGSQGVKIKAYLKEPEVNWVTKKGFTRREAEFAEVDWELTIIITTLHIHDHWFTVLKESRKIIHEDCMLNPFHVTRALIREAKREKIGRAL